MAKNEGMEKHEEFKAEFKKRVKEQAKMLYRKSGDFSAPRWAAWRPASQHSYCW